MKPYHIVGYRGAYFVYHQTLARFIAVTEPAACYLEARLAGSASEAEAALRKAHPGDARSVLSDIETLEENGFFEDAAAAWHDEASFRGELERHSASPCGKIELSLAETCNLACRYCYLGTCRGKIEGHGVMSEEMALEAVEKLFSAGVREDVEITFFGGEPLLAKRAIKAVVEKCEELAAEHSVKARFVMTTNATLIDDETAEFIASHDFSLMVSLDGPQEIHDAQCPRRDGRGSWNDAVAGIKTLMKYRPDVCVRCTLAKPLTEPMKLVGFFRDFGFSKIVMGKAFNPAFPGECDLTAEDSSAYDELVADTVVPWMLEEIASGREPKYNPFESFEEAVTQPNGSALKCGACRDTLTVGCDGSLYPCHRFVGMQAWKIGSLKDGPDNDRRRDFWYNYRKCIESACAQCPLYRLCGGPCPWEIAGSDGTFRMNGRLCEETKRWVAQGAWFMNLKEKAKKE